MVIGVLVQVIAILWWGGLVIQLLNDLNANNAVILKDYAEIALILAVAIAGYLLTQKKPTQRLERRKIWNLVACFGLFLTSAICFLFVYAVQKLTLSDAVMNTVFQFLASVALIFGGPWAFVLGFVWLIATMLDYIESIM